METQDNAAPEKAKPRFYVGTKCLLARPFNQNGADGYEVTYEEGYVSWSPKATFEAHYRASGQFDFGHALMLIKQGRHLSRRGWNGADQFVFLVKGSTFAVNRPPLNEIFEDGHVINYRPHIDIKLVDGQIATWSPSGSDTLAEDWFLFEKPL